MRLRGRAGAALAAALVLGLALAGCGETETAKPVTHAAPAQPRLLYKVGQPYQINGIWYYPKVDYDYDETGIASWYGPDFHGKDTALGEPYDMNELTAAHRTLPMPSMVRVTNLENGRVLALRVNDRGPYKKGRILDVSRRAAQLLGFDADGTARVRVQIMAEESREMALAAQAGSQVALQPGESRPQAAPTKPVVAEALPPPPGTSAAPQKPAAAAPARAAAAPQPAIAAAAIQPDGRVTRVPVRPTRIYIQAGAFANQGNATKLRAKLATLGSTAVTPISVDGQRFFRVRLGPIATVEQADAMLDRVVGAGVPQARIVVD
ncbi:MAG: septal ring lytic transglycosylase RlpA family protein [Dongiaceae bacterium]